MVAITLNYTGLHGPDKGIKFLKCKLLYGNKGESLNHFH